MQLMLLKMGNSVVYKCRSVSSVTVLNQVIVEDSMRGTCTADQVCGRDIATVCSTDESKQALELGFRERGGIRYMLVFREENRYLPGLSIG